MSETTGDGAPTLLYDAQCTMCNELAYEVRERATEPLELVALSDPEADDLLVPHYGESWAEDFYVVDGETARKGVWAVPRVLQTVGVRDFVGLVGDYLQYHETPEECDADHDHDVGKATDAGLSRRRFAKTAAAALPVGASTLSGVASAGGNRPPKGVTARVARVTLSGAAGNGTVGFGQFDVTVEEREDLVRDSRFTADEEPTTQSKPAQMEGIESATPHDGDGVTVQRADLRVTPDGADDELGTAIQDATEETSKKGEMTRFGVVRDRDRYGFSLNAGQGPMTVDGESAVETTLSGKVRHDVPRRTVDFVLLETDDAVDFDTHLRAQVAGLSAFADHYTDNGDRKMARLYREMATDLRSDVGTVSAAVEDGLEPRTNVLGVSSVPDWTRYVDSPEPSDGTHQDVTTSGTSCGCGCCAVSCCSDCGCGCSLCLGTEPGCGCGCCIIGCGGGCGCGCCICA